MRCVDVNVLVYAHRADLADHDAYRNWLESARVGDETLGISHLVLSGFLRVVTNAKIFTDPTPLDDALRFVEVVRRAPPAVLLEPTDRLWQTFARLCRAVGARGNVIPDAYLAAQAIDAGATFVTADRGFTRFPGLRLVHPLD